MNFSKYFWGLFFILLGSLFLAEQFIPEFNAGYIIGNLWPLIFVFIGTSAILSKPRNWVFGIIFITMGILFLVGQFTNIDVWNLWPVFLIFIGVSIIFKSDRVKSKVTASTDAQLVESVVFWGSELKSDSQEFTGANLTAVFGGIELDLRDAQISSKGATIDIDGIFAGVEVRVPESAEVVVEGTGIFGAFENKTRNPKAKKGGTLVIRGSAIFAGVEVK